MSEFFLALLRVALIATAVMAVVLVLRAVLPGLAKKTRCALWVLVAVALTVPLLPIGVDNPLSLVPEQVASGAVLEEVFGGYAEDTITSFAGQGNFDQAAAAGREIFADENGGLYTVTGADGVSAPRTLKDTLLPKLAMVWFLGLCAMALYAWGRYFKLCWDLSPIKSADGTVYDSDRVPTPFILGVIGPRIYLPAGLSESEREMVLAHERAHIARGDHIWKVLGYALLSIYWFHPLCWVCYRLFCRDIELACDEKVVQAFAPEQRADYSQALLQCSAPEKFHLSCPLAFGEVGVKERVKNILNYKKPAFWVTVVAIVACIVTAVLFLTVGDRHSAGGPVSCDVVAPYGGGISRSDVGIRAGSGTIHIHENNGVRLELRLVDRDGHVAYSAALDGREHSNNITVLDLNPEAFYFIEVVTEPDYWGKLDFTFHDGETDCSGGCEHILSGEYHGVFRPLVLYAGAEHAEDNLRKVLDTLTVENLQDIPESASTYRGANTHLDYVSLSLMEDERLPAVVDGLRGLPREVFALVEDRLETPTHLSFTMGDAYRFSTVVCLYYDHTGMWVQYFTGVHKKTDFQASENFRIDAAAAPEAYDALYETVQAISADTQRKVSTAVADTENDIFLTIKYLRADAILDANVVTGEHGEIGMGLEEENIRELVSLLNALPESACPPMASDTLDMAKGWRDIDLVTNKGAGDRGFQLRVHADTIWFRPLTQRDSYTYTILDETAPEVAALRAYAEELLALAEETYGGGYDYSTLPTPEKVSDYTAKLLEQMKNGETTQYAANIADGQYPLWMQPYSEIICDGDLNCTIIAGGELTYEEIIDRNDILSIGLSGGGPLEPNTKLTYDLHGFLQNIYYESAIPGEYQLAPPEARGEPVPLEPEQIAYTPDGYYPLWMMPKSVIVYDDDLSASLLQGSYLTREMLDELPLGEEGLSSTADHMRIKPNTKVIYDEEGRFQEAIPTD